MVAELFRGFFIGDRSALLITHNPKLLHYITPAVIHVMVDGKIAASGGRDLAARLEHEGFASFTAGKK